MESKERLIIQSAVAVFSKFGYRKAALDDIAKEASISRSSIYVYFKDKKEVFKKTLEYVADRAYEKLLSELGNESAEFFPRFFRLLSQANRNISASEEMNHLFDQSGEAGRIASVIQHHTEQKICHLLEKELIHQESEQSIQLPAGQSCASLARLICYSTKGLAEKSGSIEQFDENLRQYLELIDRALKK